MVHFSAPVAHTWDLKIGKCYIHTQLVSGIIGRKDHNVANTTGVTNMVSFFSILTQNDKIINNVSYLLHVYRSSSLLQRAEE